VIGKVAIPTRVMPVPTATVITPVEVPRLIIVRSKVVLTFLLGIAASRATAVGRV
jgi:hypothetical protein